MLEVQTPMTSNIQVTGDSNVTATGDIHITHICPKNLSAKTTKNKQLESLEKQLSSAKESLWLNKKELFKLPSYWIPILLTPVLLVIIILFIFSYLVGLFNFGEWMAVTNSNTTTIFNKPLWLIPPTILDIALIYWQRHSTKPICNNILDLQSEIDSIRSSIQRIKTRK
jgi:hypothetical protein